MAVRAALGRAAKEWLSFSNEKIDLFKLLNMKSQSYERLNKVILLLISRK